MTTRVQAADHRLLERAARAFQRAGDAQAWPQAPGSLAFTASSGDDIVGWCWGYHLVRPDSTSMLYLHHLEVAAEHRRNGIGRQLLHAFMAAGGQAGAAKMFLTTGAGNTAARSLYDSMGGGLATQGPTVNYWFELDHAGGPAQGRALLITGVAGVGKSTVADAIGGALAAAGLATAVVDTDALAQFGPSPGHGFHDRLKCANLAAVWANHHAAGARFAVVSAGIESAALRRQYTRSLAGCEVQVVRLVAATGTVVQRLHARDGGASLQRHLETPAAQEAGLEGAAVEDFTVVNERPAAVVAAEIIARAGWSGPAR